MNDVPISKLLIFLFFLTALVFVGCSDSNPELVSAKGFVVFDYKDESSVPSAKLAVFTEVSSEVRRVESIRIKNRSTQIEWNCSEPLIFSDSNHQWAGYTEFLTPDGIEIPDGIYDFSYIDAQGKESSVTFSINYNKKFVASNAKNAKESFFSDATEKIAVFSARDSIIYYGEKKQGWNEDKKIFDSNSSSEYYRIVYVDKINSSLCIMPAVYKNK